MKDQQKISRGLYQKEVWMKRLYNSGDVVQESTFKFLCEIKRKGTIAFTYVNTFNMVCVRLHVIIGNCYRVVMAVVLVFEDRQSWREAVVWTKDCRG